MYSRIVIYPYNIKSESAKAVKNALNEDFDPSLVYADRSYVHRPKHLVVNWGNSNMPKWANDRKILNSPGSVGAAINKLTAFGILDGTKVNVPGFTADIARAVEWVRAGHDLVARTKLDASEGFGAHFVEAPKEGTLLKHFAVAFDEGRVRLWTQYVPKAREFRIHVFKEEVIFVQEKKRKIEVPDDQIDWKIRSHSKGWIFAFNDLEPVPIQVIEAAKFAVRALELDFGACDIIWNDKNQRAYFLEVNTAPGVEGETVQAYADAITKAAKAG